MSLVNLKDATADLMLSGGKSICASLSADFTHPAITDLEAGPAHPLVVMMRLMIEAALLLASVREMTRLVQYTRSRASSECFCSFHPDCLCHFDRFLNRRLARSIHSKMIAKRGDT
nr:unnamed protein product [Callosobruchus analis]